MGWTISIKETKTETKYKIWSTIVDEYITKKWMTKKEMINFLFWHKFREFASSFMEDSMTFPNGYYEKKSEKRIWDDAVYKNQLKFKINTSDNNDLFYNKLFEELNGIGVKISVSDEKYHVTNREIEIEKQ